MRAAPNNKWLGDVVDLDEGDSCAGSMRRDIEIRCDATCVLTPTR
jgi:hypothetical protein